MSVAGMCYDSCSSQNKYLLFFPYTCYRKNELYFSLSMVLRVYGLKVHCATLPTCSWRVPEQSSNLQVVFLLLMHKSGINWTQNLLVDRNSERILALSYAVSLSPPSDLWFCVVISEHLKVCCYSPSLAKLTQGWINLQIPNFLTVVPDFG